jgi:hypothetical protein
MEGHLNLVEARGVTVVEQRVTCEGCQPSRSANWRLLSPVARIAR